jgi:hypothetical protein
VTIAEEEEEEIIFLAFHCRVDCLPEIFVNFLFGKKKKKN